MDSYFYTDLQEEDTLDTKVNQDVRSDTDNKAVLTYLNLISSNNNEKTLQIGENNAIQSLLESTFDISSPDGTVKINSMRLYQAFWRTANRLKPLDFMLHGTGRPPHIEALMTAAVTTIMDRGGYNSALRDKNGSFFSCLSYGDGPVMVGANPDKKSYAPIQFTPISINNIYMDNFCTGIRNRGQAGSAYRAVAIFSYSWNQACKIWPELAKIGGIGQIPRQEGVWKELERDVYQTQNMEDEVEIAFGVDINARNFTIFAGQSCTVLEEYNDDDFPFVSEDGTAYIPFLQFICMPSSEGPYNHGLGALLYKLSLVTSKLLNLEYGHAEDSTYPITLVNVPQGEAANFFGKLAEATRQRQAGKKPFVAMPYDPNMPNAQRVEAQTLLTNNLFQEWQVLYDTLINEIQMLGINLKELTANGNPNQLEILTQEENSDAWVRQMMEYNASETQKAVEITLDAIRKFVSPKSKIPLDLTTTMDVEGMQVRPEGITMGMIAQELRDHHYFVRVNARTGAIPSNTMLRAKLAVTKANAVPGSKAWLKIVDMENKVNDIDIPIDDFSMDQMQGAAPGAGAEQSQVGSQTDRLRYNAQKEPSPAF